MKLGLESYTTRNSGLDPAGVLDLAAQLGLGGVLFELTPFESFADDYLATVRRAAAAQGLYIEFGMGSLVHWHPMAEKGRRLLAQAGYETAVPDAQIVIQHLDIARKLGSPILPAWRAICSLATKATTWRPWPTRRSISSATPVPWRKRWA